VASACNLDCYLCSEHNRPEHERHGRGLRSMSPELFAKIENEVFPWSTRTYIGVGGEPTIVPHFADFVRRAGLAGQEIHLVTNGTRFEHGEIAQVVADHVAQLFVSLDAATPATYERIRRGSRWDRVIRGMLHLRELRERSEKNRCRLTLSFVLMRSNVRELPAFVELAHELGASAVHAQHVIPVNEEGRVESLHDEMELYESVRADAQRRAEELGIVLEAPQPFALTPAAPEPTVVQNAASEPAPLTSPDETACTQRASSTTTTAAAAATDTTDATDLDALSLSFLPRSGPPIPCSSPSTSLVVLYDGRVFPCCHPFAHQKLQMGDLRTQSMSEIWNDRLVRNLRVGMRTGDVPETCRNCSCVHDPPPGREDPDVLAASLDLSAYYANRDLAPLDAMSNGDGTVHGFFESTGVAGYLEDLRRHSDSLEAEVGALRKHAATLENVNGQQLGHIANLEHNLPVRRLLRMLGERIVQRCRRVLEPRTRGPRNGLKGPRAKC
jgi:radical SAM protein with 4Fe4S-binding SPASM domain